MENLIAYAVAYLLGAVPFGLLFGLAFGAGDIREQGSGSIGATNVLRVLREKDPALAKKVAVLTFAADFGKALAPICIARALGVADATLWAMAVLAVLGHCFSPYLAFNGGKGIATGVGAIMAILPAEAWLGLAAWFAVAKGLKISSVASLAGAVVAIASSFFLHPELPSHVPLLLIGFIIIYKHAPNIKRLISGQEGKSSF